jgi:hypothetical protein
MNVTSVRDRCRGVLIGLSAGDRIGGPVRMAVRLAESLIDSDGFDASDVMDRYLRWWQEGAFDTGPVSARTLALVSEGTPHHEAVLQVHREFDGKTAGCNPAHRSPPLSMLAVIDDDDLAACARTEARLTHYDPLAAECAAATNRLCRSLIRGIPWPAALGDGPGFADDGPGGNGGFAPDVASGALLRRHVRILSRYPGTVARVRRTRELLPRSGGGNRRCSVGRFDDPRLDTDPRRNPPARVGRRKRPGDGLVTIAAADEAGQLTASGTQCAERAASTQ